MTESFVEFVERRADAIHVHWMCRCGGELVRMGPVKHIHSSHPTLLQRGGYMTVLYAHQCTRCRVVVDNVTSYPRLTVTSADKQ